MLNRPCRGESRNPAFAQQLKTYDREQTQPILEAADGDSPEHRADRAHLAVSAH
jgi:hypothetical protein